ncbi:hypothetical protein SAMN03097708_03304 [Thiohalomonas denitrificans]|uniref:Uncharacterized protein n=2 Tax=Thiohalomonas denitrificans TaxID=415747 RepID=A0A1G5R2Q2_9GAMM|nr:hypothetical protein SAMN03097708_03304 [Thiohalomonas denitrificans]
MAATVVQLNLGHCDTGADARIRLGQNVLDAEIKARLTPATLGPALAQLKYLPGPAVLVAPYVTPPMAERLKALDVPFIDAAGNAFLHMGETFVFVTGRKPARVPIKARTLRVFRATGLRIVFALLCVPELANAPYREVAEKAGVALGSVNVAFNELTRLGFLQKTKARGRVLEQRQRLVDTWVDAYARELRPRLNPRRFRVDRLDWWKDEDLARLDLWLGGEPAAAVLTRYLRPQVVTLYGGAGFADLARRIRPVKDEHGNFEVLEPFWRFEVTQPVPGHHLTPPLLVYADLLSTAEERNLETAAMIRERYLG